MKAEWSKTSEGHWTILGGLRITVYKSIDDWRWSAPALGVRAHWLGIAEDISEDEAKTMAIEQATARVLKLCADMGEIRGGS